MLAASPAQSLIGFYVPWTFAATAAAAEGPAPASGLVLVQLGGFSLPIVQMVLALAGVLMARPLAPRGVPPLGLAKQLLVTAIMLVLAMTWVIDSRPGVLFTFVVSIGLGFSGYSLIELAGEELLDTLKAAFATLRTRLGIGTGK